MLKRIAGLCAALVMAGAAQAAELRVTATVGMVGDAVSAVAGDRAEVEVLMRADVIFYNGLLLEGKMTDTLIRAATSGKPVIAVTESVDESKLIAPPEFEGHFDPHVWMDPALWSHAASIVQEKLTELDPEGSREYSRNAGAYVKEIEKLDAYAVRVLESVPESRRVLVTAHDAFGYFGHRFGFEVVGIQGISTESEAGVRDIERLVDLIVEREIPAVFIESTVPERNVRALIAGAAARGHEVVVGGELFSDAMGDAGTYEGTYIGMIDHNVTTIARALGGDAPSGGMQGLLAE
ncbi:MAG: zinc ABC transporter substrate-binding protein [Planctomycetota bacterium]